MPSAVTASVSHTVATAPMRAPMKAQTSLPAAPPANTNVSAKPTVGRLAPLAVSTNGRKVRKAMRVALSITPTESSSGKPNWVRREPAFAPPSVLRGAASSAAKRGISTKITTAASTPRPPNSTSASRQGSTTNSSEAEAGSVILPMSPAKL